MYLLCNGNTCRSFPGESFTGPCATCMDTTHTYTRPGTFRARMFVSDGHHVVQSQEFLILAGHKPTVRYNTAPFL